LKAAKLRDSADADSLKERGLSMDQFSELPLTPPILKSLERMEYSKPTDVQARTIPLVIDGRDVLVTAQTGTGKTAAFSVPIMQKMIAALDADQPIKRALIIAPTRELAEQIGLVLRELTFFYRRLRYSVVIGGAPYGKQFRELGQDPAFVVGTPGRLIDHIETGTLNLGDFEFLVLDEADRMLDMGFAPQIEMIVKKFPSVRQTMMFSATLPQEVRGLVSKYLKNPSRVAIGEENRPVAKIAQDVVEVREGDKEETLLREIDKVSGTMIIFTKTRLKADLVASMLQERGYKAEALHGDMNQSARRKVTSRFRDETIRILVATDIAARGLDIDHVRHVFNYDLPMVPEDYIHRIGRTGRNGAEGHSVAFITPNERQRWNAILRLMGQAAPGRADGRRNYKGAAGRGAFSGAPSKPASNAGSKSNGKSHAKSMTFIVGRDAKNGGGSDRRKPFTQAYIGPTERDIAPEKFGKKIPKAKAPQIRELKAARGPVVNPGARKFGRKPDRPARALRPESVIGSDPVQQKAFDSKMNRPPRAAFGANQKRSLKGHANGADHGLRSESRKAQPPAGDRDHGPRNKFKPKKNSNFGTRSDSRSGPRENRFTSPEALKVREQFQARVEKAEFVRAEKLGRKPRFTPDSNGRANGRPNGRTAGTPSGVTAKTGAKSHKGAPDTRKHKGRGPS
jgi:ATP-dependent RNA helicase DeaD